MHQASEFMTIPRCPEDWPYHPWFRLVRRELPLDAEVPASQSDHRAWVRVDPLGESRYAVTYFEVEASRYEEIYESWDYDRSGLLLNQQRLTITGEPELKRVLNQWLDDLSKLGDPGVGTSPV